MNSEGLLVVVVVILVLYYAPGWISRRISGPCASEAACPDELEPLPDAPDSAGCPCCGSADDVTCEECRRLVCAAENRAALASALKVPVIRYHGEDHELTPEGLIEVGRQLDACAALHDNYHERIQQVANRLSALRLRQAPRERVARLVVSTERESETFGEIESAWPAIVSEANEALAAIEEPAGVAG